MYENDDVVELPPHDSDSVNHKQPRAIGRLVGTIASSLAVAGGLFVGNLLIVEPLSQPQSNTSNNGDEAVADPSSSKQGAGQSSVATLPKKIGGNKLESTMIVNSSPTSSAAKKVDLGGISFANSTSATPSGGSYSGGNTTNSTQTGGSSDHGRDYGDSSDNGHGEGHDDHGD